MLERYMFVTKSCGCPAIVWFADHSSKRFGALSLSSDEQQVTHDSDTRIAAIEQRMSSSCPQDRHDRRLTFQPLKRRIVDHSFELSTARHERRQFPFVGLYFSLTRSM